MRKYCRRIPSYWYWWKMLEHFRNASKKCRHQHLSWWCVVTFGKFFLMNVQVHRNWHCRQNFKWPSYVNMWQICFMKLPKGALSCPLFLLTKHNRLTLRSGLHRFSVQRGHITVVLPTLNTGFNSVTVWLDHSS